MVHIGAYVDREPVFLTAVYIAVQKSVARNAFRAATAIIPKFAASVQPNLLWITLLVTNLDSKIS